MLQYQARMATNVHVNKNQKESTASVLRRFVREVRGTGISNVVRKRRFYKRKPSDFVRKASAIERIKRTEQYELDKKMGKLA